MLIFKNERWVDQNNNSWSSSRYSKTEAECFSKTLVNCSNCLDCENCVDCHFCYACYNCNSCVKCEMMSNCVKCNHCYNCRFCSSCYDVNYGYELKGFNDICCNRGIYDNFYYSWSIYQGVER